MTDLVQIRGLHKHYPIRRGLMQRTTGVVRALDGVDLTIREGECLAVVGESGSGKSTLGRCVLALVEASGGDVRIAGEDLFSLRVCVPVELLLYHMAHQRGGEAGVFQRIGKVTRRE